jgi:serine O-acetyltransferase
MMRNRASGRPRGATRWVKPGYHCVMPSTTPDLERAIDEVVLSYDGPEEINNLESAALPNRRAVIEAYQHLTQVIYMGFYSLRSLTRANLRYSISEHLYPAHEILVDQIARAHSYEECQHRLGPCAPRWSEQVVLGLFQQLPALRRALSGDVNAAFAGDPAAASIEEIVFSYPGIRALTAHRIAHVLYEAGVPMIPRIISEHAHSETGIDIHAGARIGQRFFIDHGTGVVIGETTDIGDDVKVYQGVTLGALSVHRTRTPGRTGRAYKRHPTIGDNVTIYSGAKILGGNTVIGAGSIIGGNAWIVESVPPNSRIMGGKPVPQPESEAPGARERPALENGSHDG